MSEKKKILILSGPTAVGKSDLALGLAEVMDTPIISADSRQVYKHLDIGTAKPNAEVRKKLPHKLIDILELDQSITAGKWARMAKALIDDQPQALIVGGTAFYIKSLVEGLDDFPDVESDVVKDLNQELEESGLDALVEDLQKEDPLYYDQVDKNNPHRVIRALSVIRSTGKPFSHYMGRSQRESPYLFVPVALMRSREVLYERINQRVDQMMSEGLLEEVEGLLPYRDYQSLQTVGYQEFMPYFDGQIKLDEAVALVKRNTRRYAKRQMTWFRNQGSWHEVDAKNVSVDDLLHLDPLY